MTDGERATFAEELCLVLDRLSSTDLTLFEAKELRARLAMLLDAINEAKQRNGADEPEGPSRRND